jgi:hypothetical protein
LTCLSSAGRSSVCLRASHSSTHEGAWEHTEGEFQRSSALCIPQNRLSCNEPNGDRSEYPRQAVQVGTLH